MSARHILFDLDGTLIDSAPSILSGFARILDQHGISPRCELSQALIGPPLIETLSQISGIDDPEILQRLAHDFKSYYDEVGYRETVEFPGCADLLEELAGKGAHIYVVTNKRTIPTEKIINLLGWRRLFKGLYSPDSFNPEITQKANVIKRVLESRGISSKDAIYIGDRNEDLEASTANGIQFTSVGWGYGFSSSSATIKSVSDLKNLLYRAS